MDVGTLTGSQFRTRALNAIAKELLEKGMDTLRSFNGDISRHYRMNISKRMLAPRQSSFYLKWVNYGRPRVVPKKKKVLRWVDRDTGKVVFASYSSAYKGSHYKEKIERMWAL